MHLPNTIKYITQFQFRYTLKNILRFYAQVTNQEFFSDAEEKQSPSLDQITRFYFYQLFVIHHTQESKTFARFFPRCLLIKPNFGSYGKNVGNQRSSQNHFFVLFCKNDIKMKHKIPSIYLTQISKFKAP